MPDTDATEQTGSRVHAALPDGYRGPERRSRPAEVIDAGAAAVRTLAGLPPGSLTLLALIGAMGILLYAMIWISPRESREAHDRDVIMIQDAHEQFRSMYREEAQKNRKAMAEHEHARSERDKALLDAIVRVEGAVAKWEKKP